MSTPRTAILRALAAVFTVLGPSALDICPSQVTIRTRVWSGGALRQGTTTDTDLVLPQQLFLRQVTTREIENSGGRYEQGDIAVTNIVPNDPANPGIGYTESQLAPVANVPGMEILYFVTGQHAGDYTRGYVETTDPFEYRLFLTRRRTQALITG